MLARIPGLNDVVIWDEANNTYFWPAAAGADAYEHLLARCWDRLHGLRSNVNVVDSTAPHRNPAGFLRALGDAYRSSRRPRPILDTYGHNVYPDTSDEAPSAQHTNGSIDEGDYGRLMSVLGRAFGGTAQPLPGQGTTTIWYLEDGFQTSVPPSKRRLYRGHETMRLLPQTESSAAGSDQATRLGEAIDLAYCQPAVGAFFNFQLFDDRDLGGWQSGVLWPDGTPKPAYGTLRTEIERVQQGAIDC